MDQPKSKLDYQKIEDQSGNRNTRRDAQWNVFCIYMVFKKFLGLRGPFSIQGPPFMGNPHSAQEEPEDDSLAMVASTNQPGFLQGLRLDLDLAIRVQGRGFLLASHNFLQETAWNPRERLWGQFLLHHFMSA